jgi:glutathione reductase (NADPH)
MLSISFRSAGIGVHSYDLIVLGGGSGGLAAAQRAGQYGARAVIFEPGRLGGTCVNVGCVPKKVMWNAAELAHAIEHAPHYGFDVQLAGHDFTKLKRGRDAYVRRLNEIYARNLDRRNIPVVASRGVFAGRGAVVDERGECYEAPHVIVATGGYPTVPDLPGADLGITSDGFFDLEALPRRVAVVGSGYIAVELAGVLNALGSQVTLFMRYDRLLRHFDHLLSDRLMQQMAAAGVELVTHAIPAVVAGDGELTLEVYDGRTFGPFDTLLWAVGRTPQTRALNLESVGVSLTASGHIEVDEFQNTASEGIYAIGDVTGQAELTPVAIAAGRRLADRLFDAQRDRKLGYELVPSVIFSHPPIGTVGLTEEAAVDRFGGDAVRVYESEFVPMFHALTETKPVSAMKLVVAGPEERVVGCHVIGPGADEMMQGFAVAMSMGATKRDLDDTIAIHPTSAEELVTMR